MPLGMEIDLNREGYVNRGELQAVKEEIITGLQTGQILLPQVELDQPNYAGGTNHCPDSDFSYSKDAATIPGTLPATVVDTNFEAWRAYRQDQSGNVTPDAAHALKATGHSLFAANEGANTDLPIWNRHDGWVEIGALGATQYDIAIQLLSKIVGPGQRWYVRAKLVALNAAIVPGDVQLFAGLWHKTSTTEGWIQGGPFSLDYDIIGPTGPHALEYRVLAKTDSGLSILSNVLNVPDAPPTVSPSNYVKLFYPAGPGFIEFQIYKKDGAFYSLLGVVRNSTDLQFNDIGFPGVPQSGWPADPGNAPRAYAESRNVLIAPFKSTWSSNDLTIDVPSSYNFQQTLPDGQFLRLGLTAPPAIARHIGIDRIWFSTTFNAWAPDAIRLSDGTAPIPSIDPTEGNQGGGGPVFEPPHGGSGGGTCILQELPVLVKEGKRKIFRPFLTTGVGDRIGGETIHGYQVLRKRLGAASEYIEILTHNGIRYECNGDHRLVVSLAPRRFKKAQNIEVGDELPAWVRGRIRLTTVTRKRLVPRLCTVGTYVLRDMSGVERDGHGVYVAGYSANYDRGLFCSNVKPLGD